MDFTGIVVVVGNYGSGKTETAINLAAACRKSGMAVTIADLDLVNPYFRTREARIPLEAMGIQVILPDRQYMFADLPILAPAVADIIRQPSDLTILDAGGDDVGVTVLGALASVLQDKSVHMLQVINAFRPFTGDVAGCIRIKEEIEASAKLKVTGFVSNANLMDDTLAGHIREGYELVKSVADHTRIPLEFITAPPGILAEHDLAHFSCPVLTIDRTLLFPWKRTV